MNPICAVTGRTSPARTANRGRMPDACLHDKKELTINGDRTERGVTEEGERGEEEWENIRLCGSQMEAWKGVEHTKGTAAGGGKQAQKMSDPGGICQLGENRDGETQAISRGIESLALSALLRGRIEGARYILVLDSRIRICTVRSCLTRSHSLHPCITSDLSARSGRIKLP